MNAASHKMSPAPHQIQGDFVTYTVLPQWPTHAESRGSEAFAVVNFGYF